MNSKLLRHLLVPAIATVLAGGASVTLAEEVVQPHDQSTLPKQAINEPVPAADDRWSGYLSLVSPTDYVSRGLVLNRHGFVAQASGELDYTFYRGSGAVDRLTGFAGTWNNFNSAQTGAANNEWEQWYEFDWYVGGTAQLADDWTLTLTYIEFASPSDAFDRSRNVELKVAYDDAELLGRFALNPYVKFFRETNGKAGSGVDEGTYVELGMAPSLPLTDRGADSVRLTFPLAIGLGFDRFYGDAEGDNQTLGFVSSGVVLGVPVAFLNDTGFGAWTFTAGATLFYFGDGTSDFNEAQGINERARLVGSIGLTCAF